MFILFFLMNFFLITLKVLYFKYFFLKKYLHFLIYGMIKFTKNTDLVKNQR